jgi:glutathione-regulated potassium-efflux system ancillary protein KefF
MPDAHAPPADAGIYLMAAHPRWRDSRVTQRLMAAAAAMAANAPGLRIQDLYARYPDYDIDVAAEQSHVEAAQLLVLVHPIQWSGMPALQKLWLDEVLRYGWAYGAASAEPGSSDQAPAGAPGTALRGKDLWLVASANGTEDSAGTLDETQANEAFLGPYRQAAALCGMRLLPPLVLRGADSAGRAQVEAHVQQFCDRLRSHPAWR